MEPSSALDCAFTQLKSKQSQPTYIYALVDPRLETRAVRYVGKSVDPHHRLIEHAKMHGRPGHNAHKENWIRQLQTAGLEPIMQVLQECGNDGSWCEVEWIALLRAQGEPLTNMSTGGTGGWPVPLESRRATNARYWASLTPDQQQNRLMKLRDGHRTKVTSEQLAAWGRKGAASKTADQHAECGRRSAAARTHEQSVAAGIKGAAKLTHEQHVELGRRANAALTHEQRVARTMKAWATKRRKQSEAAANVV
jgi:hypothetical protein